MKTLTRVSCSLGLLLIVAASTWAQSPQSGPPQAPGLEKQQVYTRDTIAPEDLRKLADFMDKESIIERKDLVPTHIAKERVTKVFALLKVDCKIVNVAHVAEVNGKQWGWTNVAVGLYEAACENGTGYLVTLRDTHEASATSCFAAESQITEPSKASRAEHCLLPENANANMRAQKMLSALGVNCAVDASLWLGQNATLHLDYIEAHCKDEKGYVMHMPVAGFGGTANAVSCEQSLKERVPCRLSKQETPAATSRPDLVWFKEQLKHAGIACDVTQARIIGRESVKRRYVAEFECKGNEGIVAFVPSPGDTSSALESMNCSAAVSKHITCEFPQGQASATKPQ